MPVESWAKRLALAAILAAALALTVAAHASAAEVADASCQPTPDTGQAGAKFAQTFTALHTGKLTTATMKTNKPAGTTNDYLMEIRTVDGSGVPTATVLASASVPAAGLPDDTWADITTTFSSPASVVAGQQYALVLSRPGSNLFAESRADNPCPGGAGYSAAVSTDPFTLDCFPTCSPDRYFAVFVTPPPANDNFASAAVLTGSTASVDGSNVDATEQSGEDIYCTEDVCSDDPSVTRSVWYRWTSPGNGPATVDLCAANSYDTMLAVFTGSTLGSLALVGANNNSAGCPPGSFASKVSYTATQGTTYQILVDGCCGLPAGTFTLTLNGPSAPPPGDGGGGVLTPPPTATRCPARSMNTAVTAKKHKKKTRCGKKHKRKKK